MKLSAFAAALLLAASFSVSAEETKKEEPEAAAQEKPEKEAAGGIFFERDDQTPKTETQERAAKALADRYPEAKMAYVSGGGAATRRGYRAAPFIFMGPAGFMQARFKAEVACSEVSLDGESPPVFAMFFISPKEKRGVLVVDTQVSAAACAPKGDKRRTGAGMKEFRDFMESHDAYSKNFFRKLFGK